MTDNRSYLPACWSDELRMQALFSPFRKKDLNPAGWQEKMDFWVKTIEDYCIQTNVAVVNTDVIRRAFKKDNRYPNCIDDVLAHMHLQGLLKTPTDFSNIGSSSWIGWGFDLAVKKPLSWGFSFVKDMMFEKQPLESSFIFLEVISDMADKMVNRHSDLIEVAEADYVMDIDVLQSKCLDICQGESFQYALMQLQREKKVLLITEDGRQYVKFKKDIQDNETKLSDIDKAVLKLCKTSQGLLKEIEILERDIDACSVAARQLVRQGSKTKAMAMLKKRKRLENELNKKMDSYSNLETLQLQLKDTDSGKKVMDAFNVSVAAMKSGMKDTNIDKVDETMADLEEAMDDVAEMGKTLSKGLPGRDTDDDDLEAELNNILSSCVELPDVPVSPVPIASTMTYEDEELEKRLHALSVPFTSGDISPEKTAAATKVSAKT